MKHGDLTDELVNKMFTEIEQLKTNLPDSEGLKKYHNKVIEFKNLIISSDDVPSNVPI